MTLGWPEQFRDTDRLRFRPPWTEAAARWWIERFHSKAGLFPQGFLEQIIDGAPGVITASFNDLNYLNGTFEFEVAGFARDNTRVFYKRKRFEIAGAVALEGETQVSPDWQGHGIGTGLMANLILLGRRIGLDRIDIDAQDIGRYAWLTMGFLPDVTSWRRHIVPAAKTPLRLALLTGAIDQTTSDAATAILSDPDPRAIRNLLLLPAAVRGPGAQASEAMVPLLKVLMLQVGTDWSGSYDFGDEESGRLFDSYKAAHDEDHPKPW